MAAVAAATWVTSNAMPALPSAAKALPALKPYQPTHSIAAPAIVKAGLCAGRSSCGVASAATEHPGDHQRGHAATGMHHQAAREIHHAEIGQPAAAPHPVGDRRIDDDDPERAEQEDGGEFHALGIGSDDQRRRDDGEGHLKHEKGGFGYVAAHAVEADAVEKDLAEAPDHRVDRAAIPEGEAVDEKQPKNGNRAAYREDVHQDRDHVLGADEARVKQGKAKHRHEQDQGGGGEHPRRVGTAERRFVGG